MEKVFRGNQYNFKILMFPLNQKRSFFAVGATHNHTKRTSFITNVNVILSELNIPSDISKFWGSEWILSKKEANNLTVSTQQLFSDRKFLSYLEKCLDLDREQSKWENYE